MASSIMALNSSLSYNTQSTSSFEPIKFNSFAPKTLSSPTPTSVKTCLSTSAVLTLSPESTRQFAGDDQIRRLPLAKMWREVQGSSNWKNLVSPLNPILQNEIVRYGEFVNACYKAFDLEPKSRRYLNCKHGKKNILKEVGLESSGYEVTKYIYATPGVEIPTQSSSSRWIGYVAVSSDSEVRRLGRRDIVVAFRGTVTNAEWVANLMSSLTPARLDPHNPRPEVKVERGFLGLYSSNDDTNRFSNGSCREQLLSEVRRLINLYKDEEISITLAGHSMGSSLAILFGYDLAELGLNVDGSNRAIPITVYSFAGPRVGSLGFKERCDKLGVKVLRVVNVNDPITKFPGVFLNENFRVNAGSYEFPRKCSCYAHVGVELALDFFKMKDPSCVHDLGHLIRLVSCPRTRRVQVEKEKGHQQGLDFFNKIVGGSATAMQMLDSWQWQEAAMSVCNLVQTLGI